MTGEITLKGVGPVEGTEGGGEEEDFGTILARHEEIREAAKDKVDKLKNIFEEVKLNQAAAIKEVSVVNVCLLVSPCYAFLNNLTC